MDSPERTLVKTLTWQVTGLVVMTLIGLVMTGSFAFAGGFAAIAALCGTLSYVVHERIWNRIAWGRHPYRQR